MVERGEKGGARVLGGEGDESGAAVLVDVARVGTEVEGGYGGEGGRGGGAIRWAIL